MRAPALGTRVRARLVAEAHRRPAAVAFWVCLVTYLAFYNPLYFNGMTAANLDLAWSLVRHGTPEIFGYHGIDAIEVNGRYFSGVAPGSGFLALPVAWLGARVAPAAPDERLGLLHALAALVLAIPIGAAAAAAVTRLTRLHGAAPLPAATAGLLFGLGTNHFAAAVSYNKEALGAAGVVATLLLLTAPSIGAPRAFLAGLCAATLPMLQYADAVVALGLLLYAWTAHGIRSLVPFVLGLTLAPVALGVYHAAAFGAPWVTAYHWRIASFSAGDGGAFSGFSPMRLLAILVGPYGFFVGSPILLIALVGTARLWLGDARCRRTAMVSLGVFGAYALAYAAYQYEGVTGAFLGWRFFLVLSPWLAVGIPAGLTAVSSGPAVALGALSLVVGFVTAQAGYLIVPRYLYALKVLATSLGGGVFFGDFLPRVLGVATLHLNFREPLLALDRGSRTEALCGLLVLGGRQALFAVVPLLLWLGAAAITAALVFACARGAPDAAASAPEEVRA